MPPDNINQNNYTMVPNSKPKNNLVKNLTMVIFIIIFIFVIGYLVSLIKGGLSSTKFSNNFVLNTSDTLPPLNTETRQYFTDDTNALLKDIGINQDAFNLDANSKVGLSNIVKSLEASSTKVIFNTLGYTGVEKYSKADTYYLKPTFSKIPEAEYLKVVTKENIKPEEFLSVHSNPIDRDLYKIFYENYIANNSASSSVIAMKVYLDKQITAKTITKYEYGEIDGYLRIYYPNEEIAFRTNPSLYAEAMNKVITGYADPGKYIDQVLANYQSQFSQGDILIINTKNQATSTRTINSKLLQKKITVLLDDKLTKEEKLTALSGRVRFGDIEEVTTTSAKTPVSNLAAVSAGSVSDVNALLDQSGTIVPPNQRIYIFQGPDSPSSDPLGSYVIKEFEIPDGAFSSFTKNDYWPLVEQRRTYEYPTVEKFATLLINDEATNVIFDGHGHGEGYLLMETYYIGEGTLSSTTDPNFALRKKKFVDRIKKLRTDYPNDSGTELIGAAYTDSIYLTDQKLAELHFDIGGTTGLYDNLTKKSRIFGDVYISPSFFEKFKKEGHKKSLVITQSCYSGTFASSIGARVILTAPLDSVTNAYMFFTDLAKINPYLAKAKDPGNVSFDLENARTYNILNLPSFVKDLVKKGSTKEEVESFSTRQDSCVVKADTLCTIVPSGTPSQTIAISPSVKTATGESIEFNAPMEKVSPEKVVTIDASKCGTAQKVINENLPVWNGDKNITLSWKDKIYRDWNPEKDFDANGKPKVNYAIVSVKNNQAVSKISQVRLTGNSDACISAGCFQPESWTDPDGLKYNGNNPKTDFVMMFPCIEDDYYASCKAGVTPNIAKIKSEEGVTHPDYISTNGNCYHKIIATEVEKKQAVEVTNWTNDSTCSDKCVPEKKDLSCTDFNNLLTTGDINTILGSDSATMVIEGPLNPKPGRPGPLCTSLWKNLRTSDMHNYNEFQKFQQSLPGDAGKSINPSQIWDELEKPPVAVEAMLGLMSVYGQFIKDRLEPFHELHGGDYGISFMGLMMNGKIINNGSLLGSDKTSKVCDNVNPMDKVTGKVGVKKTDLTDLGDGEACLLESNTDKIVRFIKNSDIKVPGGLSSFYPLYVRVEKDKSDSQAIELARLLFSRVNEFLK